MKKEDKERFRDLMLRYSLSDIIEEIVSFSTDVCSICEEMHLARSSMMWKKSAKILSEASRFIKI